MKSTSAELNNPRIMSLPLRGEWLCPNTPASKIPSHGTNLLGTRYAIDFIQVDWSRMGNPAYRVRFSQYLIHGAALKEYYCWGQDVYAPCAGVVVAVGDGYKERERTNLFHDMARAYRNAHSFDPKKDDVQTVAGNYIIIAYDDATYAALCHLQPGSIAVSLGQKVRKGNIIAKVGHSGNSFGPHLHFQLMDRCDIATANGIPCAFEEYEQYIEGTWVKVENGIPTTKDRIRFLDPRITAQ